MEQNTENHSVDEKPLLFSINDVLNAWRIHYGKHRKWLFRVHMAILIPWLVIRYLLLQPVYIYFRDLIREQNGDIRPTRGRID